MTERNHYPPTGRVREGLGVPPVRARAWELTLTPSLTLPGLCVVV